MKVCAACADEARRLGINVEFLDSSEGKKRRRAFHEQKQGRFSMKLLPRSLIG